MRAFQPTARPGSEDAVASLEDLLVRGWTYSGIRAQIDGRRWQRFGRAILLHNTLPTFAQKHQLVLLNCGPRAVLTAFTAVQAHGLEGWERDETHVLVPGGTHVPSLPGLSRRVHFVGTPLPHDVLGTRRLHRVAPALLLAASTFRKPRPACGILASGVQQRLVTAEQLAHVLDDRPRLRHRRLLAACIADIGQGARALSEIDFARVCRRFGLPEPVRQAIRIEPDGRRRYLDAEWIRADGQRVVVEIDGALHLAARRWWDDQLRQNELAIAGSLVLRFPSALLRAEPELVAGQLRRMLAV